MDENKYGNTSDYLKALKVLKMKGIAKHHISMLNAHLKASGHAVTWENLAKQIGYRQGRAVNLHYGKFAKRICEQLGLKDKPIDKNGNDWWLWALVRWNKKPNSKSRHTVFVLRKPVINALKKINIT